MNGMFARNPFNGDISSYVSNVTNMLLCSPNAMNLIRLSSWDVSNVIYRIKCLNELMF